MLCSIEGCTNIAYVKGLCRCCYDRQWRNARPLIECALCHQECPVHAWEQNQPLCMKCYAAGRIATCVGCGRRKRVAKQTPAGSLCHQCYQPLRTKVQCSVCGRMAPATLSEPPVCFKCYTADYNDRPTTVARKAVFLAHRRMIENVGDFTSTDWLELMCLWNWRCAYCDVKLKRGTRSTDHIIPLTRGGENNRSNIVPCCCHCNSSKNNRLLSEWLDSETCAQVLLRIAEIGGRGNV